MTGHFIGQIVARGAALSVQARLGHVNLIRILGDATLDVDTGKVQSVFVNGVLSGLAPWEVIAGIQSMTAGAIADLQVTSSFLATLLVTGNRVKAISGDITGSSFRLTGLNTLTGMFAMRTLTATGAVRDTTIDVTGGNVGTVTVGKFLDSNLYLDHTPAAPFNTGGQFSGVLWRLGRFATTAIATADPASWAFAGSQIAADEIGAVRLSGLKTGNGGTAFGVKFRSTVGSVRVAAADDPAVPLRTNLTPNATAIAGDFFFLDV